MDVFDDRDMKEAQEGREVSYGAITAYASEKVSRRSMNDEDKVKGRIQRIVDLLKRNDPIINSLNLKFIRLDEEKTDELVSTLRENSFISKIILEGNELNTNCCKKFFSLLLTNPKLTHIELLENNVDDEAIVFLSESLRKIPPNHEPISITLRRNKFGPVGARALAAALAANAPVQWLDLRYNESIGDEGAQAIGLALADNKILRGLDLLKCKCGYLTASALQDSLTEGNKRLETLLLQDNLGMQGLRCLGFMLQEAKCPLTDLYLWQCDLDAQSLEHLCRSLRNNQRLSTLALSYNKIDDNGAIYLGDMILHNHSIKKLQLGRNLLTSVTAGYIGLALTHNTTIEYLDLSRNKLKSMGVWALAVALRSNKVLKTIDLRHNTIDADSTEMLCEVIEKNTTITMLRLSGNRFGDTGVAQLAEKIRDNKTLRDIELDGVGMTSSGFRALCEALKYNDSLESLSISENVIKDDGMEAFAGLLKENKTLTNIRMCDCWITDVGCRWIGEGMQQNSTLNEMDIACNNITARGLRFIHDALIGNYSITKIEYPRDNDTFEGGDAIKENIAYYTERNSYYKANTLMRDMSKLMDL